jgi:putative Holliday junction resolvase
MSRKMPIVDAVELLASLPKGRRIMAFDVGTKRIGLALADPGTRIVSPIEALTRTQWSRDAPRVAELIRYWSVGGLVVGLALNMDGSEGPSAQRCRSFARNLLQIADLPLAFRDERLSSHAAEDEMIEAGVRPDRRRAAIDSAAAALILRDLLAAHPARK